MADEQRPKDSVLAYCVTCGLPGQHDHGKDRRRMRLFKDGDQWCATRSDFKNLQESPAGFGDTDEAAVDDLMRVCA